MFDLLLEDWYLTTNGSIVYHHCAANDEFVKGHWLEDENVVVVETNDSKVRDDVQRDGSNTMDARVVEVVEVIVLESVLGVVVEVLEDDDDERADDDDAMDGKDDEVKPKVSIATGCCSSLVSSAMMNE